MHPQKPFQQGSTPGKSDVLKQRQRPTSPLLIRQWKYLWYLEFVELRRGSKLVDTGRIDQITEDGNILWIYLSQGKGRIMIHRNDGVDVWRVDSRSVCRDSDQD